MESSTSNSEERELQQMQLEERHLHSKCMAWFKELNSHLETFHNNKTPFKKVFDSKEVNASNFQNKCWQKHFKDYTRCEPETYRRKLLRYLKELDKLIDKRQQESLVTEGTTLEANLSTDGTTLDGSLVTEGTTLEASLVTKGISLDASLVAKQSTIDSTTSSEQQNESNGSRKECSRLGNEKRSYDNESKMKEAVQGMMQMLILELHMTTYQTLRIFPPKENSILNKAKELTPSLYSIDKMGQDLLSDHKIIFEEELKCEAEKRLKVKQRKSMLSYHGFVYGLTQFEEPPKVPLKRRDVNLKKHLEQAQLSNYDPKLWKSLPMKYFCYVKHAILKFEKETVSKQNPPRENVFINLSFEDNVKRIARNQLSEEFEPLVKYVNLQLNCFENGMVKEMKEDLKYVTSF
ncbi:hypothetical protein Tco_0512216 [Tanacetum coccineum]